MAYVLRKSVGPFSAGTRVVVISENDHDGTLTVEVRVPEPNRFAGYNYSYEDLVFDIDKSEVVELRNRVDTISTVSRQKRRVFLRKLFAKTQAQAKPQTTTET